MLECCRVLSHWWFDVPLDAHYTTLPMRPKSTIIGPMEGWERKGDLDVNPRLSGDWPFAVECKDVEGKSGSKELERMFETPKYPLWSWWDQCVSQAETWKNAYPILIFSRARKKKYVLTRYKTLVWLQAKPIKGPLVQIERPGGELLGMILLDDLVAVPRPRRSSAKTSLRAHLRKTST